MMETTKAKNPIAMDGKVMLPLLLPGVGTGIGDGAGAFAAAAAMIKKARQAAKMVALMPEAIFSMPWRVL
ncbi:hypothetical protein SLE2022_045300 [Rubroshorea leprosula]